MEPKTIALLGVLIVAGFGVGMVSSTVFATPLLLAQSEKTENSNTFGIMGHVELVAHDADGNIKQYLQTDNIIVNNGEDCLAEAMFNVTSSSCSGTGFHVGGQGPGDGGFTWLGIGTNATPAAEDDTALGAETGSRLDENDTGGAPSVTSSTGTGAGSVATVVLSEVFTPGAVTIAEAGLFDASTGGNMLARQQFTGIPLGASDQLTVQWTVTLGADT